ncbi:MAG: DUF2007 domain-containing protein [Bacteroidales bacterium]|nr:DUF2007 domain-containing protein [Bacteroidales bacterium]MBN2755826.1 DUF2007 domain-containing protein [Bacteroidales bacterium]
MKDWIKIQSFERIHQAELRKDILEKNGIPSVIINEKDSLFLLGEIELYVKKNDEAKAKELIDEFSGLTKINSYVGEKQMRLFRSLIPKNEIHVVIKEKKDSKFVLDNYELYINNEDLDLILPYLTTEKLPDWEKIETCNSVSQTKYRTDILDENKIENFIVKRKDSEYHLDRVEIYVNKTNKDKAINLLKNLNGWHTIRKYSELNWAEIDGNILNENNVKAIIFKNNENEFEILVEADKEEKAIDIINTTKEWVILKNYSNIENAMIAKRILEKNNIYSVIINEKDSAFLIGDLELYVEIDKKNIAENILKNF